MIQDLSRSSASRLTLATQAVSAALALGAIAIVAVGLPERQRPSTTMPVMGNATPTGGNDPSRPAQPGADAIQSYRVDMRGLADRLAMLDNAPTPPVVDTPPEPAENTNPKIDDGVPPQPFASRVRYLGMIQVGDASMAFVNIDGSQRVVRTGSVVPALEARPELGDLTIKAIRREMITVSHEDGEADIQLSSREGPAITLVAGGEVDRVEASPEGATSRFETNANGNPLPASEIDRRRRAIERQRTQDPRDYDGPGLRMPETRVIGSMGTRRPSRDRNNEREQNERNTGGDE